ncbi:hypothetical protein [Laceyella putida]|uniref:Uncharacterized protein n=1 Tax=Laceyella putida TaxID=110101 RepID=A0ABW2RGN6_9BACL
MSKKARGRIHKLVAVAGAFALQLPPGEGGSISYDAPFVEMPPVTVTLH